MKVRNLVALGAFGLMMPISVGVAGVVPLGAPSAHTLSPEPGMMSPGGGGFGDRTPGSQGVVPNDMASMAINMTAVNGQQAFMNAGGHALVTRGPSFTNIGAHRDPTTQANILASWDEVVSGGRTYLSVIFKTSNGAHLVPVTSNIGGVGIFTWNWSFGTVDPVDYQQGVTAVSLVSARAYFSRNGGTSFFTNTNIAPNLPSNFMPSADPGTPLLTAGDGTNYVLIRYEIDVTVPTPATALPLASGLAFIGRRRRR